jgi:hypothetical protein
MVAKQTSQWMAHALQWDATRREDELRRYREATAATRQ